MGIYINGKAQNIIFQSGICCDILVMLDMAGWLAVIEYTLGFMAGSFKQHSEFFISI